jgi:hypothetical protein
MYTEKGRPTVKKRAYLVDSKDGTPSPHIVREETAKWSTMTSSAVPSAVTKIARTTGMEYLSEGAGEHVITIASTLPQLVSAIGKRCDYISCKGKPPLTSAYPTMFTGLTLLAGAGEQARVAPVATKVELKSSCSLLCGGWYIEATKWKALPSKEVKKEDLDLSRVKLGESQFVLQ